MSADAANIQDQLRLLQEENATLKGQLAEPDLKAFEQIKELRSTTKRLTDEVKRLTGEGVQLAFKNRQMDQQLKKLQADLEQLQGQHEALQGEHQRVQGELAQAQAENQRLNAELNSATERGRHLDHSVEELQGELSQSREQILSHEAELQRQRDELSQRQQHMSQLQTELTQREQRISKLEQLVTDFKEQFLSGDFEAVAPVEPEGQAYQVLLNHLDLALGIPGRTLVDQVYELLEVDKDTQDTGTLEEVFDTLLDTGTQLFSEEAEQQALKDALQTAWSLIQADSGDSVPTRSPAAAIPLQVNAVAATPEPVAVQVPQEEVPAALTVEAYSSPEAQAPTPVEEQHEAPPEPFPPDTSAAVVPSGESEHVAVTEPSAQEEPEALSFDQLLDEAEEETPEPAVVESTPPQEAPETETQADEPQSPVAEPTPAAAVAEEAAQPEVDVEAAPVPELETPVEEQAAQPTEAPVADAQPEPVSEAPPGREELAEVAEETAISWIPPEAAAKSSQIAEALGLVTSQPDTAVSMLEQALQSEVRVAEEARANLAMARLKANQENILPYLNEALGGVEIKDLFPLFSAAEATAPDEMAERLGLFYQFGMTPRTEMAKMEGTLGLGKRSLNRDFVAAIGNPEEEDIVAYLRDNLLARSGLNLPVPSKKFEERLEFTGPAAFVGTLRQALRAVDYSLFDFLDLKVLTYDGPEEFLVDASSEPELTLVFHRDIEGMPPEELCFLVFRHLVRMYRGHSQLAHQSSALTNEARLALTRAAVELFLEENSPPHPSLMERLDALQADADGFETLCSTLLCHWYEASGWDPFLWTREYLFDDEIFRKRLNPVADHAAARLCGITAATYGCLRDELLGQPDLLEEFQEGLNDLFEQQPKLGACRMRVQRMWNEFLLEE